MKKQINFFIYNQVVDQVLTVGWDDKGRQIKKYISYHEKRTDTLIALARYNDNPMCRFNCHFGEPIRHF